MKRPARRSSGAGVDSTAGSAPADSTRPTDRPNRARSDRRALEELGRWGAGLGPVGPPVHERSIRAIAMALQAVLARAGDPSPQERLVVELEIDGELAEIILDQRPTVTARPSLEPDARMRASTAGISAVLMGQRFDSSVFTHVSGDETAAERLVTALS